MSQRTPFKLSFHDSVTEKAHRLKAMALVARSETFSNFNDEIRGDYTDMMSDLADDIVRLMDEAEVKK